MFRYQILGLLRTGDPLHGYALMKEYNRQTGRHVRMGNFYRELHRLEGAGFVHTAEVPDPTNARRITYEITNKGARVFDTWLLELEPCACSSGIAAMALLLEGAPPELAGTVLTRCRERLLGESKRLVRDFDRLQASAKGETDARQLAIQRQIAHVAADLRFLDEIRDVLKLPVLVEREMERPSPSRQRAGRR